MPHAIHPGNDPDGASLQARYRTRAAEQADRTGEAVYLIWDPTKRPGWHNLDLTAAGASPYWVSESMAAGWERQQGERIGPQSPARAKILAEVSAERARQDDLWGGAAHDDQHSLADWLVILVRHVGLSAWDGSPEDACHKTEATGKYDPVRFRRELVRVAAVAVAALEAFDRRAQRQQVEGEPDG